MSNDIDLSGITLDHVSGGTRTRTGKLGRPTNEERGLPPAATQADNRKQSLYFPEGTLEEVKAEAARLNRSMSWVIQRAWALSKDTIAQMPSQTDI